MTRLITPIIADNFEENWKIVDAQRRTAKKKYITSTVASFFSNMVFAVLVLIVANCLIHDHMTGSYCDFLEEIPYLIPLWKKASAVFLRPGQSWLIQVLLTALVVYGICFVVCGIFVLLVLAVYHPFKRDLPAGSPGDNAAQILSMARDARRYANRTGNTGSAVWALVFMVAQFVILAMYCVLELSDLEAIMEISTGFIMELLEPYMTNSMMYGNAQGGLFMPLLMVYSLLLYLCYAFADLLHALSVQFMYRCRVPYSFVADVEYCHVFADEDFGSMSDEEKQQWLAENAEAKCEKATEMELLGAYGKAKELFAQAAHSGSASGMEHYARHWLIANAKDPARYWLQKCVDTGNASETAVKLLRRLKWHRRIRAEYMK